MRLKQERNRFCIIALLCIWLGAAFYFLLYEPQIAELRAKEEEVSHLRQERAEVAAFRRAHPEPGKDIKNAEAKNRVLLRLLPEKMDTEAFLAEATRYAKEARLFLSGVAPEETEMVDGLARQRIVISVRGDYFALLDFLYALEQLGRFTKVDAVRGKTDDGGVFTGTIELLIFAREK